MGTPQVPQSKGGFQLIPIESVDLGLTFVAKVSVGSTCEGGGIPAMAASKSKRPSDPCSQVVNKQKDPRPD